jgi:hypothetical protein
MTPREMTRTDPDSSMEPFSLQELVLHGRPNLAAALFFLCMAALHTFLAIQGYRIGIWQGSISAALGLCFLLVAVICMLARSEILICPRARQIRLKTEFAGFKTRHQVPFSAVRAVRVTLWKSKRQSKSRLEILCDGEEIPCPPTTIPRQQALYLALVMKVRLIKVCDDRQVGPLTNPRSW